METLMHALSQIPNRYRRETDLQDAVAAALTAAGIVFQPEYRLGPRSRIDFATFTDRGQVLAGIECKVAGSSLSIQRQLYRYADYFDRLVLVTSTPVRFGAERIIDGNGFPCDLRITNIWQNPS